MSHRISFLLLTACLACLACASACSSGSASPPAASAPPSADTLCKLRPGASTEDDALAALGTPYHRQTFPDGSADWMYEYGPASSLVLLDLTFSTAHTFTQATVVNTPQPLCWLVDGGH